MYSRIYWWSLNLAVWPQTEFKKISVELKFGVASQVSLSRSIVVSHLRYLNKAMNRQIYKKYNWQSASAKLTTCTATQRGAGRDQECYCMHYIITRCVQNNIGGF